MINVKDIRIGDYFRVNREGLCIKKGSVVEVRGIDADDKLIEKGLISSTHCHPLDDNQFNGGIWCDYLDPIPLTPEILERNGFKHVDKGSEICIRGEYLWGDKGKRNFTAVRITYYKGLSSGVNLLTKIETDCSHDSGINMVHSCDIEYVHQLQHALRLCGIEKEIRL